MQDKGRAFASHERSATGKNEWLTPQHIITALGSFDLDPCSPVGRPWDTARQHLTILDDGLTHPWAGRVWLNPPYGSGIGAWMQKMSEHNNGIALVYVRTDTGWFHRFVWPTATGILFLKGRIAFYNVDGSAANSSSGAPSCLVAYGPGNLLALSSSGIEGKITIPLER